MVSYLSLESYVGALERLGQMDSAGRVDAIKSQVKDNN